MPRLNRQLQDTRYTATIEVTKTELFQSTDRNGHVLNPDNVPTKEQTSTRVTVRSGRLDKLQEKVVTIVQLLDAEDLTEEQA